jgi:predicted RNA-binding protein with RPS1 domain
MARSRSLRPDGKEIKAAKNWIHSIVAEPEVGVIYEGTVVKVADFGAFVNFFGPKDGLVHISQLASERVAKTSDVVKEGDKVWVKLLGFDERGKVRLSMKVVDQETGKEGKDRRYPDQPHRHTDDGARQCRASHHWAGPEDQQLPCRTELPVEAVEIRFR